MSIGFAVEGWLEPLLSGRRHRGVQDTIRVEGFAATLARQYRKPTSFPATMNWSNTSGLLALLWLLPGSGMSREREGVMFSIARLEFRLVFRKASNVASSSSLHGLLSSRRILPLQLLLPNKRQTFTTAQSISGKFTVYVQCSISLKTAEHCLLGFCCFVRIQPASPRSGQFRKMALTDTQSL